MPAIAYNANLLYEKPGIQYDGLERNGRFGSSLNDELNRMANGGAYRDKIDMVDMALAARQWAAREFVTINTTDTVGVINQIAGLGDDKKGWLDFNGVCNYIAGTTGLPAAAALRTL